MRWIPVSENQPDDGQLVLAFGKEIHMCEFNTVFFYRYTEWTSGDRISSIYWDDITHWMPLPLKPGDESPSSDPAESKGNETIWEEMINKHIKPMYGSLEAASIKHFIEKGTVNGSFRLRLIAMMKFYEWRVCKADPAEVLVKAIPPDVARKILLVRDALIKEDREEAYHHLYSIASPNFEEYEPWKELEEIANYEQLKQQ